MTPEDAPRQLQRAMKHGQDGETVEALIESLLAMQSVLATTLKGSQDALAASEALCAEEMRRTQALRAQFRASCQEVDKLKAEGNDTTNDGVAINSEDDMLEPLPIVNGETKNGAYQVVIAAAPVKKRKAPGGELGGSRTETDSKRHSLHVEN
ncbi:hypothetical protein B0A55_00740 [Friedmanniomyces simplex]|uniref:Uncharacterized protein n=1 Tax=Friedmanniomyces simplex TaxID=329884 RepID=A0A4U0XXW5_9PEZI|nr:hypothetical protein B0A55_00740 [Friedmanniomyces simplex]